MTLKISCSCLISKQNAIANKNPNAADDNEQTFNYRWAKISWIIEKHCYWW